MNLPLDCGEVEDPEGGPRGWDGEHKRYTDCQFLWDVTLRLCTLGVWFPSFWKGVMIHLQMS